MPYKVIATVQGGSEKMYDVIDMKLSRAKKVIKLFMTEELAEQYAKVQLKKNEDEFKVIEVDTAYEYEEDGFFRGPNTQDQTESV